MMIDSACLLLIGLILAGFIHQFLNEKSIVKHLKGKSAKIVIKSALIGVPLPLCSCSVLPVAHQLKKSGLNNGGTAAFLISTPETGVDSILLTYSLCDPLMTIARPVSAFITAVSAGLLVNNSSIDNPGEIAEATDECGCCDEAEIINENSFLSKLYSSLKYSFGTLLKDLAPYLFTGYLLAGILGFIIGDSLMNLSSSFITGWGGYIGAVLVGLPMYICATSSTPLAAVLLKGGFSPGAVLVFLLVGPATNLATLAVVSKIFDKRNVVIYLVSIVAVAILCGIFLDFIYNYFEIESSFGRFAASHGDNLLYLVSAVVISFFICYYSFKLWFKKLAKFFLV